MGVVGGWVVARSQRIVRAREVWGWLVNATPVRRAGGWGTKPRAIYAAERRQTGHADTNGRWRL